MSIFDTLRGLLGGRARKDDTPSSPARRKSGIDREQAAAWLAALESGKLSVPENVQDAAGWDRYWSAQIESGGLEQGFNDMMASEPRSDPAVEETRCAYHPLRGQWSLVRTVRAGRAWL